MEILAVDDAELDRELVARPGGFSYFIKEAWPIIEPSTPLIWNWHIDFIAEVLEAASNGEISRLLINIPPGFMKTSICSILWHPYVWTKNPGAKWITGGYSSNNATRDSLAARQLVESNWYQERWGHMFGKNQDMWASAYYKNTKGGFRRATTAPNGQIMGAHADYQLVDDPIKPTDASAGKVDTVTLQQVIEWWDQTMSSRTTGSNAFRGIVMQRLHQKDLSGHVIEQGGYTHVMLPQRFETDRKCVIESLGLEDPRTEEGELLWPNRYDDVALERRAKEMGPMGVAGQEQQRPSPAEGGIVDPDWWQRYKILPPDLTDWILSCDLSGKETKSGSYTVFQVWARRNADMFLIDQWRKRCGFPEQMDAFLSLIARYPQITTKIVEDKSNGTPLIDMMKKEVVGVEQWPPKGTPKGSKIACLNAVAYIIRAGNVFITESSVSPWVDKFLEEITLFPASSNDDQVDATSQALDWYSKNQRNIPGLRLDQRGLRQNPRVWGN